MMEWPKMGLGLFFKSHRGHESLELTAHKLVFTKPKPYGFNGNSVVIFDTLSFAVARPVQLCSRVTFYMYKCI